MSSSKGPKRPLFTKPSWAAKATKPSAESDAPIFGQNLVYEDIVAAEQRLRERHAARAKERAEKDRLKKEKEAAEERNTKRRRISKDVAEEDDESSSETGSVRSGSHDSGSDSLEPERTISKQVKHTLRSTARKAEDESDEGDMKTVKTKRHEPDRRTRSSQPTTIMLDDEEEGKVVVNKDGKPGSTRAKSPQKSYEQETVTDSDDEEEDEYLRELKMKARQEARTKTLRNELTKQSTPDVTSRQTSQDPRSPSQGQAASILSQIGQERADSAAPANGEDDPKVFIHVKTIIPNARSLVITRHASQPLDKVREYWCQRNELPPAIASKVFFTWNGTRLYDSTTMRGIIERLKKIRPMPDGSDPSEGRIEIEAMTDEIFEHRQKQKERRMMEAAGLIKPAHNQTDTHDTSGGISDGTSHATAHPGESSSSTKSDPLAQQATHQPTEKTGIVIKLTSPGIEDMMLRLRPNTTVGKIISGYRKLKKIESDKQCWLMFDGDKLEDHMTVEEVGFEHEDTVEVHLR